MIAKRITNKQSNIESTFINRRIIEGNARNPLEAAVITIVETIKNKEGERIFAPMFEETTRKESYRI